MTSYPLKGFFILILFAKIEKEVECEYKSNNPIDDSKAHVNRLIEANKVNRGEARESNDEQNRSIEYLLPPGIHADDEVISHEEIWIPR